MFNTSLGEVFNTSAKPSVLFHTSTARALRAQPSLDPYRFLWYPNFFFSRACARAAVASSGTLPTLSPYQPEPTESMGRGRGGGLRAEGGESRLRLHPSLRSLVPLST